MQLARVTIKGEIEGRESFSARGATIRIRIGRFSGAAAGSQRVFEAQLSGYFRAPIVAAKRSAARHAPPDRLQLGFRLWLVDVLAP